MAQDNEKRLRGSQTRIRKVAPPVALWGMSLCLFAAWTAAASALTVDTSSRAAVASFYNSVYLASNGVPANFTGNVAACNPGSVSLAYQNAGLNRILYFRAMAGLNGSVTLSTDWNSKCQAAALMMSANRQLSHAPPTSWTCYTSGGAEAASKSNLAYGPGSLPAAIDLFMGDTGVSSLGHRRWILYPPEQTMGVGATFGNGYNAYALWVIGGTGGRPATPEWVAWPSAGYFPYQLLSGAWSFSYPAATFTGTTVAMTLDGVPLVVALVPVQNGYGDNTLAWLPQGVPTSPPAIDRRVHVSLTNVTIGGVARNFAYDVTIIDPNSLVGVPRIPNASIGTRLYPNTPNPFANSTTIRYSLATESRVQLAIYDVRGRLVMQLDDAQRAAGEHATSWDGETVEGKRAAPGIYLCKLYSEGGVASLRMLLLR